MPHTVATRPKLQPYKQLEPGYYPAFHCVADACPDTCCDGWRVSVDKSTYDKYQRCADPVLQPKLRELVVINTANGNHSNYANIQLTQSQCPFLTDNLCSIQKRLGEDYLGKTCATYPRIVNLVDGVMERSLDLSCPEAARLALLDPNPLTFFLIEPLSPAEGVSQAAAPRLSSLDVLDASESSRPNALYRYVPEVRRLVLSILQNRGYSIEKRLVLLAHVCDKLNQIATDADGQFIPDVLQGFAGAIETGLFDVYLNQCSAHPSTQLSIILELIIARLNADFAPQRYRDLYREFMSGIQLSSESTIDQIAFHYSEAYAQYYAPFMRRHEYMLEHYLVNYAFKTLFPFGSQTVNQTLNLNAVKNPIAAQYMIMASYFAQTKALMIGLAANRREAFSVDLAVTAIQSCSRTLEHCTSYPTLVLQILAAKGIGSSAAMAALTQS